MLDLITQSLADLDDPSQPWSKAIITNLKQAFFFAGQKDVEHSFRKLQMTDHHIEQYPSWTRPATKSSIGQPEACGASCGPLTDPYTYWLATTDPRERRVKTADEAAASGKREECHRGPGATGRPLPQYRRATGRPGALPRKALDRGIRTCFCLRSDL